MANPDRASRLSRCISGLVPKLRAEMTLEGASLPNRLSQRSLDQQRRVQMVFQMADTALNPRQTVGASILRPLRRFAGLSRAAAPARLDELLEMVELSPALVTRFPGELSGGQKPRVCIARALAAEPDVIICDEVTSALDQLVQEGGIKLLNRIQQELGTSYIFITHDVLIARAISDEVIVMSKGRVVDRGSMDEVFAPPYQPYTEKLIRAVPEMSPDWLEQFVALERAG